MVLALYNVYCWTQFLKSLYKNASSIFFVSLPFGIAPVMQTVWNTYAHVLVSPLAHHNDPWQHA